VGQVITGLRALFILRASLSLAAPAALIGLATLAPEGLRSTRLLRLGFQHRGLVLAAVGAVHSQQTHLAQAVLLAARGKVWFLASLHQWSLIV
jgi:hypothetical protein